jgi:hypothetical protein
MPAQKIKCTFCQHKFYACRSDTLYCSEKCRSKDRQETAKFKEHYKSNIPGITWNRIISRWEVRIKINNKWKYIGAFKEFTKAYLFQIEVKNVKTNRT